MVYLTNVLFRIKPNELGKHLTKSFIDKLRIYVKSGNGGLGYAKMGGIGGDGASIYIKGKNSLTLKDVYASNLKKRYIGRDGQNSKRTKLFGDHGENIVIPVPCGVTAVTDSGVIIGELNSEEEEVLIAKGGKGGSPFNNFIAHQGQAFSVNLDLKLIADVGLIGFPNAGKSTLLSLISRARPKIASYPFTTLNPQLGIIEYDDKRRISVADLPGVVEGAHMNRGMGHKFLKHISRTKLNLFVVDVNGFQLSHKFESRSAFETVVFLNKELELYERVLVEKPSILVVNKMDTEKAGEKFDEFMRLYQDYENSVRNLDEMWIPEERVKFDRIFNISAKTNENVEELCLHIREILDHEDDKRRKKQEEAEKTENKIIAKTLRNEEVLTKTLV